MLYLRSISPPTCNLIIKFLVKNSWKIKTLKKTKHISMGLFILLVSTKSKIVGEIEAVAFFSVVKNGLGGHLLSWFWTKKNMDGSQTGYLQRVRPKKKKKWNFLSLIFYYCLLSYSILIYHYVEEDLKSLKEWENVINQLCFIYWYFQSLSEKKIASYFLTRPIILIEIKVLGGLRLFFTPTLNYACVHL